MTTDLTFVERTTLLVLMAESRPVKNTELSTLGSRLEAIERKNLVSRRLITAPKVGRGLVLELTDAGWQLAAEEFKRLSVTSKLGGKAYATLVLALIRHLERVGTEPNEVFLPVAAESTPPAGDSKPVITGHVEPEVVEPPAPADVETRIRSAYHRLAREPKAFVSLTRLRADLAGLDRRAVDDTLSSLYREQKINLIPEANQKTLTDEDRSAALHIGGQNRHMVTIK
ncbi:hypothetical protein QM797_25935 [Rhodococcus sp. IEGM 1381]|uniref:hypothetical protein n=1 Tax=Rhodococcus sp. IEGM 1381 TaxID=3047085 RepID=UPI0024B6BB5B|nr:hypothetical protein [Rhodococcus sp. IEGM 1381]MDI9898176.1 hypothetical protein [Rhodococcus sp. IEGM 1381]